MSPETGKFVDIIDYDFLPTVPIAEMVRNREISSKDVLMAHLADNSVVLTSIETGAIFMWFELDLSKLDEDDAIVDFQPTYSAQEPFFVFLTKKGKIIIYHYALVDNNTSFKKYWKHLNKYEYNITDLCRDKLRPKFNEACNAEDYKTAIEAEVKEFDGGAFIAITNVDFVDLPFLYKNETKITTLPPFDEVNTVFKHI